VDGKYFYLVTILDTKESRLNPPLRKASADKRDLDFCPNKNQARFDSRSEASIRITIKDLIQKILRVAGDF